MNNELTNYFDENLEQQTGVGMTQIDMKEAESHP